MKVLFFFNVYVVDIKGNKDMKLILVDGLFKIWIFMQVEASSLEVEEMCNGCFGCKESR